MHISFYSFSGFRNTFLLLLCFSWSHTCFGQTDKKPVLKLSGNVHDYGEVENISSLLSVFDVKNTGDASQYLLRADAPRGVTVDSKKKILQPGETTTLSIVYKPKNTGPFNETIKLYASGSKEPFIITIKGTVKSITADPLACYSFSTKTVGSGPQPLSNIHTGKVIDTKTKQGIPNARVQFVKGNKVLVETLTGRDGTYKKILPLGLYNVEASAQNYRDTSQQQYINKNSPPVLLELEPLPVPVVVATERPQPVLAENPVLSPVPVKEDKNLDIYNLPLNEFNPNNIVFLVDISGSMKDSLKLPLLQHSVNKLLIALRNVDKVAIVTYADSARLFVPSTQGDKKEELTASINTLRAKGYTAANQGIAMAYATAVSNYIEGGNNQVILATDGIFKLTANDEKLFASDSTKKVKLSVLGFGKDKWSLDKLRLLAKKTGGNFIHITDSETSVALLEEIKTNSRK